MVVKEHYYNLPKEHGNKKVDDTSYHDNKTPYIDLVVSFRDFQWPG